MHPMFTFFPICEVHKKKKIINNNNNNDNEPHITTNLDNNICTWEIS